MEPTNEVDKLIEWLKFCPTSPGLIAEGLLGWARGDGSMLCSTCWGRLANRGLHPNGRWTPVWDDQGEKVACATAATHQELDPGLPSDDNEIDPPLGGRF